MNINVLVARMTEEGIEDFLKEVPTRRGKKTLHSDREKDTGKGF